MSDNEIPIESDFTRFIDVSKLIGVNTGRRFSKHGPHFYEEEKGTTQYEVAEFGEFVFEPPTDVRKNRFQKITIIYARISNCPLVYCS